MAFKRAGFSGFKENDNELPQGFYESYKKAPQTNKGGQTLDMGGTKQASIKAGKFTPIYTKA
jgi:hypothetical protein|tara:strand:+ start:33 stop:218 length:186 start_codon:yes stop_codon:yes gene_type:complete